MADYTITQAQNGWILNKPTYRDASGQAYVFNSAAQMADWIKSNLDKKPEDEKT